MNGLEMLQKAGKEVDVLEKFLRGVVDGGSELAPVAAGILADMEGAVTAEKLAGLLMVLPTEFLNSVQGKFDGRFHPGGAG